LGAHLFCGDCDKRCRKGQVIEPFGLLNPTRHSRLSLWRALVIVLGTAHGAFAVQSTPYNYVINRGFEADADGNETPDDWKLTALPDDLFVKGYRSPASRTGDFAYCLEKAAWRRGTNLSGTSKSSITPTLSSSSFEFEPGTTCEIRLWLRMEGPLPVDEVAFAIESNAKGFWGSRPFAVNVGRERKQHSLTVTTESDTCKGALVFSPTGNWLDRLFIDDKPRRWGIWAHTQLDAGLPGSDDYNRLMRAWRPINPRSHFDRGYQVLFGEKDNPSFQADAKRGLMKVGYQCKVGKIGLDSHAGSVPAVDGRKGDVFVRRVKASTKPACEPPGGRRPPRASW
jgi:hypothetical protein